MAVRPWPALLLAFALCACAPSGNDKADTAKQTPAGHEEQSSAASLPQGKGFDFYVLSLSWSPSYCEAEGPDANRQQCGAKRPYAFVVHGLWPQFEHGYPQGCASTISDLSEKTVRSLYDLMPSAGLIRHEWKTHGACTSLDQADYFRVLRAARDRVMVPDEFRRLRDYLTISPDAVEQAFLKINPDMQPGGIAVDCDRRYLREMRICMTRDLAFRPCAEVERRSCRLPKVVMPPVRGG